MKRILVFLNQYKQQCVAATGVEYGLLAAGISLAMIFAVFFFGTTLEETFTTMITTISAYLAQAQG